ncbi:response regulator [Pararhodobacter oceanensis]|uniref:DNA-binding response regulator n=1 Tax=Pararhodobacter oceanensis TaxID=2172121 RepID=A0A2T8HZJ6_9RHOB|nr:response regulator transcription factor [Pararhodobacter oceanensis]PVH30864.1 DNA-binding response regulator [Pararhodobacter oceanensis]
MTDPIAPQILIVDDARDIREPLGQYLRKQGFRTRLAANAAEAREILAEAGIHMVVLDIMMPGEDGLSLCRWLVAHDGPPVLLLTAMADETDRIVGLELGADDYLVKPFNPRELLARVRAILRRAPPEVAAPPSGRRVFAGWLHDPDALSLAHEDGRRVDLTSAENRLLGIFLDQPRHVMSRATLLDLTAGREAKAYDRAIDNQISRLRRKIEDDPKKPQILVTEWGGGYRLVAEVAPEGPEHGA